LLVAVAYSVQTRRTEAAMRERAVTARAAVVERNPVQKSDLSVNVSDKSDHKQDTRAAVASKQSFV
jgi:hypothetical protein